MSKYNNLNKYAYQQTCDEDFLQEKRDKKWVDTPLAGVKLTAGLSPAEVALDNTAAVTSANTDVISKYAHFLEGFFHAKEKKKKTFWDDVPVFSNKGGMAEYQKGPPTMFAPGYDVGGGV